MVQFADGSAEMIVFERFAGQSRDPVHLEVLVQFVKFCIFVTRSRDQRLDIPLA